MHRKKTMPAKAATRTFTPYVYLSALLLVTTLLARLIQAIG